MENNYKTADLPLAAYLAYKDFIIERLEDDVINPRKDYLCLRERLVSE